VTSSNSRTQSVHRYRHLDTDEAHYSALLQEEIHDSGAEHCLNRTFGERFADEAYAFEEPVADVVARPDVGQRRAVRPPGQMMIPRSASAPLAPPEGRTDD